MDGVGLGTQGGRDGGLQPTRACGSAMMDCLQLGHSHPQAFGVRPKITDHVSRPSCDDRVQVNERLEPFLRFNAFRPLRASVRMVLVPAAAGLARAASASRHPRKVIFNVGVCPWHRIHCALLLLSSSLRRPLPAAAAGRPGQGRSRRSRNAARFAADPCGGRHDSGSPPRSFISFSEFDRCTCKRGGAQPAEKRGVRHRCEDRGTFTELDQRESIRADAAELDGVGKLDHIAR